MKKLFNSAAVSIVLLILVIALICGTYSMRKEWWMFSDIFALFMAAFCNLMSNVVGKMKMKSAQDRLNLIALIFLILFVIAFIVEFFVLQTI